MTKDYGANWREYRKLHTLYGLVGFGGFVLVFALTIIIIGRFPIPVFVLLVVGVDRRTWHPRQLVAMPKMRELLLHHQRIIRFQ